MGISDRPRRSQDGLARHQAFIVFDSEEQFSFEGARASRSRARRVRWVSAVAALDLEITRGKTGSGIRVYGQIESRTKAIVHGMHHQESQIQNRVLITDKGEFELDCRPGDFALIVDFEDCVLDIPRIALK